jgi:hypothetical protein
MSSGGVERLTDMDHRVLLAFLLPVVLTSPACSSSSGSNSTTPAANPQSPPLLGEDADPIDPGESGFPYPSNVWLTPDKTTVTGYHQYYGPTTLPEWAPGKHIDPAPWASKDGFSPGASMLVFWPDVSVTGLPSLTTMASSVEKTSPTIIMEADTGALVPHWDELDDLLTSPPGTQAFFMRPAIRLKDATRYIVAIHHVQTREGKEIAPAPEFQALRDNSPSNDVSVGLRRSLYADIIGKLQNNGITTSDLQIAWDFTTASQQSITADMVSMRDQALALVGNDGPSYTITPSDITDNPNPYIRRRIVGTMTVPLYLTNPASCQGNPGCPGSSINRDANGKPKQNGTASYQFLIQIPNSIVNEGTTGAVIQNAHGLLGDFTEGQDGYMAEICDRLHEVEIAVNLEGFADDDSNYVTNVIAGDLGQFQHVVDRIHQGYINELLAMRMMIGKMATDPNTMPNGMPTIDTTHRYYRGDSQGGIGGGVYMAISTDVTRGLLDNTGAPYDLLLNRSVDFAGFFVVLKGIYTDPAQLQLGINLIQQLWDNAEPDGYISYITDNTLPCAACSGGKTPSHNVLIHDGLGDQQVTPWGAHFEARTLNAHNLQTTNRELYGIPDAPGGFTGNGICEFNFWLPDSQNAYQQIAPSDGYPDPHDALRQLDSAQDMADQFFRTGMINQTCAGGGPCAAPGSAGNYTWSTTQLLDDAGTIEAGTNPDAGDGGAQ